MIYIVEKPFLQYKEKIHFVCQAKSFQLATTWVLFKSPAIICVYLPSCSNELV